ncbi:hypothetical protein PENSPDRAFT_685590 [Peniophora sp. CONT]|nr:hypothetical protein PENSPDRAFT_685590 [Peniophora sp. CONT]
MYLSLPIFTKVKQLSIKDLFDQDIMVALELYKDVRSLTLSGGALASFVARHAFSGPGGSVLFPALEEINIVDRKFPTAAVGDDIFMMNMEVMLENYVSPETNTVVYIDSESCVGAQQVGEWLRKRLGEDRVVVEE